MTQMTLWLAQFQFYGGLVFLLLCLALEFGLAWVLLLLRTAARDTSRAGWVAAYRFWVRVFALALTLASAVGVSLLIQTGGLLGALAQRAGDVLSPALGWVLACFFITRTAFVGLVLFGHQRLPRWLHTGAVALVATGSTLAIFFLLAALAWLQTPAGAQVFNEQYVLIDPLQALFNPGLLGHALLFAGAGLLLAGALMVGVVAGRQSRHPADASRQPVLRTGFAVAVAGLVLHLAGMGALVVSDKNHQPARAAAVVGYWDSGTAPNLALAGWPDATNQKNHYSWSVRNAAAPFLATDKTGQFIGLDQFSGMTPPVAFIFWSFRIIVLCLLAIGLVSLAAWRRLRRHRYDVARLSPGHLRQLRLLAPIALVLAATTFAWVQAGALPYAVQGTITFSEVLSPIGTASVAAGTLLASSAYVGLSIAFILILRHTARHGVIPISRHRRRA